MAERISALRGYYQPGGYGRPGTPGVVMQEIPGLVMHQVAAWPQSLNSVESDLVHYMGLGQAVDPGQVSVEKKGAMLRIEPLKWWLLGSQPPAFDVEHAVIVDLSHARSHVRIGGPTAAELLNRHCPLDLRPQAFPLNSVASSMMHHVGITLWHSKHGFDVFIPRGFALSIWQVLVDTALQFGLEIKA